MSGPLTMPIALLGQVARHGRLLLVAGLVAGIGLPGLALAMRPYLPELVTALMFIAALRIGPRQAFGAMADARASLILALLYQTVLPLALLGAFVLGGWQTLPAATALVLMASASPISGSPNLTLLSGGDPAPALRLMIVGTALLPLTVIPVLWASPALGSLEAVLGASLRLLALILSATALAFAVRHFVLRDPAPATISALDGLSAIAMSVVVIGLMSSAGPALANQPGEFFGWLALAFAANFGLQIAASLILRRTALAAQTTAFSIIAGNRNIALFLVALPAEITNPLLLFIGCYQIPMYLTPILLARFHARR